MRQPLWTPSAKRIANANITRFAGLVTERENIELPDYRSLHRWSIDQAEKFWPAVWDFCEIVGDKGSERVVENREQMPGAEMVSRRTSQLRRESFAPARRPRSSGVQRGG